MMYTFRVGNQLYRIGLEENGGQTLIEIEGEKKHVEFQRIDESLYSILINGKSINLGFFKQGRKIQVFLEGDLYELESITEREKKAASALSGVQKIKATMPSRVVNILKDVGDDVKTDEGIVVVEAMKMESELKSTVNGKVKEIKVNQGQAVEAGTVLALVSTE